MACTKRLTFLLVWALVCLVSWLLMSSTASAWSVQSTCLKPISVACIIVNSSQSFLQGPCLAPILPHSSSPSVPDAHQCLLVAHVGRKFETSLR
eukprot:1150359-Pelagomonas_calceolata.AAC.1